MYWPLHVLRDERVSRVRSLCDRLRLDGGRRVRAGGRAGRANLCGVARSAWDACQVFSDVGNTLVNSGTEDVRALFCPRGRSGQALVEVALVSRCSLSSRWGCCGWRSCPCARRRCHGGSGRCAPRRRRWSRAGRWISARSRHRAADSGPVYTLDARTDGPESVNSRSIPASGRLFRCRSRRLAHSRALERQSRWFQQTAAPSDHAGIRLWIAPRAPARRARERAARPGRMCGW